MRLGSVVRPTRCIGAPARAAARAGTGDAVAVGVPDLDRSAEQNPARVIARVHGGSRSVPATATDITALRTRRNRPTPGG